MPRSLHSSLDGTGESSWVSGSHVHIVKISADIELGDKANHIPAFHVPQVYYFVAFSTIMGWPALISGKEGLRPLIHGIIARMWGSKRSVFFSSFCVTVLTPHPGGVL
jgi:alpha-1,2-glucosyltransferase